MRSPRRQVSDRCAQPYNFLHGNILKKYPKYFACMKWQHLAINGHTRLTPHLRHATITPVPHVRPIPIPTRPSLVPTFSLAVFVGPRHHPHQSLLTLAVCPASGTLFSPTPCSLFILLGTIFPLRAPTPTPTPTWQSTFPFPHYSHSCLSSCLPFHITTSILAASPLSSLPTYYSPLRDSSLPATSHLLPLILHPRSFQAVIVYPPLVIVPTPFFHHPLPPALHPSPSPCRKLCTSRCRKRASAQLHPCPLQFHLLWMMTTCL